MIRGALTRLLKLREGELMLVLAAGLLLFGNSAATQITGVAAVSGFLSEVGVKQILLVWILDFLLMLPVAGLQSLFVDRYDRVKIVRAIMVIFAVMAALLRLGFAANAPNMLTYGLMYLLADQQWLFFPAMLWVMAADLFSMAQTKRLFPLISSFGLAGKLFGLGITLAAPTFFHNFNMKAIDMLWVNVAIYGLGILWSFIALRGVKITRPITQSGVGMKQTLSEAWGFIKEVPAFRYLMLSILLMMICDTIIEFHFLATTESAFPGPEAFQTFFALYRLGLILALIAGQNMLSRWLLETLGIKNTFFILPIATIIGAVLSIFLPGVVTCILLMAMNQFARDTANDAAIKSMQSLIPEERRGRVTVFMESYLTSIGTIAGSLITGTVVLGWSYAAKPAYESMNYYGYLGGLLLVAASALWTVFRMRRSYESSMLNWRLNRRKRGVNVLENLEF